MTQDFDPDVAPATRRLPGDSRPADLILLQNRSLTMLVQREIERMILNGELPAGSKLNEANLAGALGVSRGPVREAFRALEETGLVRLEKNRGVFVREISVAEADEIYEIRAHLDQLAGRKLAATITPGQLAILHGLLAQMEQATRINDLDSYHPLNLRFHESLVQFTGNGKLLQLYRRLVNELSLFRRHSLTQMDRLPTSTQEHKGIVDAIAAGDAELTARLLHEHASASRARMHRLFSGPVAPDSTRAPTAPEVRMNTRR